MNRILDKLIPKKLTDFDRYLLENHPVIWQTKIHFIIPIALVCSAVLFIAGLFYPATIFEPNVHPITPIKIQDELYFAIPFWTFVITVIYWVYQQLLSTQNYSDTGQVYAILIYVLGAFFLVGTGATSFGLGMIYRTAYHLMDEDDIDKVKNDPNFSFGFFPFNNSDEFDDRIIKKREVLFEGLGFTEDKILNHRYDLTELPEGCSGAYDWFRQSFCPHDYDTANLDFHTLPIVAFKAMQDEARNMIKEKIAFSAQDSLNTKSHKPPLDSLFKVHVLELLGRIDSLDQYDSNYKIKRLQRLDSLYKEDAVKFFQRLSGAKTYVKKIWLDTLVHRLNSSGIFNVLDSLYNLNKIADLVEQPEIDSLKRENLLNRIDSLSFANRRRRMVIADSLDNDTLSNLSVLERSDFLDSLAKIDFDLNDSLARNIAKEDSLAAAIRNAEIDSLVRTGSLTDSKRFKLLEKTDNLNKIRFREKLNNITNINGLDRLDRFSLIGTLNEYDLLDSLDKAAWNGRMALIDRLHSYETSDWEKQFESLETALLSTSEALINSIRPTLVKLRIERLKKYDWSNVKDGEKHLESIKDLDKINWIELYESYGYDPPKEEDVSYFENVQRLNRIKNLSHVADSLTEVSWVTGNDSETWVDWITMENWTVKIDSIPGYWYSSGRKEQLNKFFWIDHISDKEYIKWIDRLDRLDRFDRLRTYNSFLLENNYFNQDKFYGDTLFNRYSSKNRDNLFSFSLILDSKRLSGTDGIKWINNFQWHDRLSRFDNFDYDTIDSLWAATALLHDEAAFAYRCYGDYNTNKFQNSYSYDDAYWSDYFEYYKSQKFPDLCPDTLRFKKYGISFDFDTVANQSPKLYYPKFLFTLKDAVWSVEHARQYLRSGIVFKYYGLTLFYLTFVGLFLYVIPYFNLVDFLKAMVISIAIGGGTWWIYGVFYDGDVMRQDAVLILSIVMQILFLCILVYAVKMNRKNKLSDFVFHLLIINLLLVMIMTMVQDATYKYIINDYSTYSLPLFSVLTAIVLPKYFNLPKSV